MRSRVHNRTRDRGGKPIRLAWPWALPLVPPEGTGGACLKKNRRSLPLALLWQIFRGAGFPNHFFCDSWVVGFWRGRPWLAGRRIGETSLDVGSSRFWIGWVTKHGDKCARSTCRD